MAGLVTKWATLALGSLWIILLLRWWGGGDSGSLSGGLSLASWRGKPKVMVIGGAGHVGMHLVGMLRDRQVNVTAIDQVSFLPTKGDKLRRQRIAHLKASYDVDVINAPYCNPAFLAKQIEKDTPTHIVYFAYTEKVWFSLAEQTSSLVQCMQEVLDVASIDTDTRLLMVTTVGLGITSEADSVHNSVATLAEGLAWGYHRERKTKVSTVRIGGEVIGPWEHTDMVLTAWAEAAAQKAQVITEVQSTGMLYVKDVAHDLMAILPQAGDSDRWAINDALYPYATVWREIHSAYSLDWSFQNPNLRNAHHHEDSNSIIIPRRTLPSINRTPARDAVGSFLAWYRAYAKDEFVETEVMLEDLYQETIREAGGTKLDMQVDERDRWLDWAMMAKVKLPPTVGEHKYKFFSDKYSLGPPNLLLGRVAKAVGLEILKNTCDSQPRCVGFNTDGMLLTGVLPVAKWEDFPADKKKNASEDDGLFVAEDLNLCEYGDTYYCHLNSHCEMIEPAQYRCVCDEGYTQSTSGTCDMVLPDGVVVPQEEKKEEGKDEGKGEGDVDPAKRIEEEEEKESNYLAKVGEVGESKLGGEAGDWVHVVVCSDQEHSVGLATLISSILENTLHPERVQVHVVSSSTKAVAVSRELRCHGLDATGPDYSGPQHQVVVVPFDEDSVKGMYRVHTSTAVTGNLGSALNFARFYLASLLPAVSRAVYLDVDTVVQGDLGLLCAEAYSQMDANPNMLLAVAQRLPNRPMSKQVHKVYYERYGKDFNERDMVQYNAGVFVVDLARWREQRLTEEAEFWMRETTRQKLWDYGSQPVMYMCCHGRTLTLDWRWNVDGLGWNTLPANRIAEARILHWSGKSKPWDEDPPNKYRDLWIRHMPDFTCQVEAGKA
eukprot:comp23993_c0_seq4/m.42670 comp23993_c0_seq4/g.42670  ORF comp23993_c0_seq4/g.42670 comp23993_c0_seq4/m.42670 type:complete len:885 (-) comp23993_c0_seq4:222-2876(-)